MDGIDHAQVGYEANPSVNLTRSDEANLTISCHPEKYSHVVVVLCMPKWCGNLNITALKMIHCLMIRNLSFLDSFGGREVY